jgi:hypothetical protein
MSEDTDPKRDDPAHTAPASHHLIATGMGAAMGAAFTGAAVGTFAGPVGAAIGATVGAAIGGLTGHIAGGTMDYDEEEAHWRERHAAEFHAAAGRTFEDYRAAYRVGYTSFDSFALGTTFEKAEPVLRERYEAENHALPWHEGRMAAEAAWNRAMRGESIRKPHAPDDHTPLHTASSLTILADASGPQFPATGSVFSTGATGTVPKGAGD